MEWTIGSTKITSIIEQDLALLGELIAPAEPDLIKKIAWLVPHFADADGHLKGIIQSFIVETPSKTIVVDTCVGNDKDRPIMEAWHKAQTNFMDRFTAAGFEPTAIDIVLCTHMHLDHVGWNTYWDGAEWQPTFPNARYLFADLEKEHWDREYNKMISADPPSRGLFKITQKNVHEDSVLPIFEKGLADVVSTTHQICPEVCLYPTPGHTPGHVSILISSEGENAIISGDCVHHPCQIAHPEWFTNADVDKERGIETRNELFKKLADTPTILIGSHFAEPTAGTIRKDGDSYRLETDED